MSFGNAVDLDDAFDKAVLIFSDNNAIASSVYGKCASCTLKIINMAFIDDRQTNGGFHFAHLLIDLKFFGNILPFGKGLGSSTTNARTGQGLVLHLGIFHCLAAAAMWL